jgi:hypothetical protein
MASEYHRGEMDIHEQTASYHLFVMMAKWGSLALAAALVFLVLLFCTPTGFFGSLIVGVVIAIGGFLVLREHGGEDAH